MTQEHGLLNEDIWYLENKIKMLNTQLGILRAQNEILIKLLRNVADSLENKNKENPKA
jgi:hypothetical protein